MIAAAENVSFSQRAEVIVVAVAVCGLIFELVRRKHLMERYAILWLLAGATLLLLAVWQGLLTKLSHAVGIHYPPAALFAVAFLFVLVMLIHFSVTISRLSDQNTMLAQRLALLQQRLEPQAQDERGAREADGVAAAVAEGPDGEPTR